MRCEERKIPRDQWSRLYNAAMLIYAGIDEAGYGPMLGPLCVAASAFVVHDHDVQTHGDICDLWKRLNKVVCRKRTDKKHRIAIDDSKKLKLPNDSEKIHPLKHLERGVLSFLNCIQSECDPASQCDDDLFQRLAVNCPSADWYKTTTPLPIAQSNDELRIAAARLKRTLEATNVECALMRCEAIDAHSFNQQVQMMGFKSNVNFCAVMRLVDAIWKRWPDQSPHIVIDRQGGRTHYLRDLLTAYPDARIQVLDETELISQYRLEQSGNEIRLTFCVEAETANLPVALASMTAKYVRELFMSRLNRYFQSLMPELKPTAGYTEDARRYLTDIEPVMTRAGIDRNLLVRCV